MSCNYCVYRYRDTFICSSIMNNSYIWYFGIQNNIVGGYRLISLTPHSIFLQGILITHWGRVTHKCVGKLIIISSDNGLSPGRRQATIWNNAWILLIGPLGINFREILIEIYIFFIHDNAFEIIVWEMATILPRGRWVNPLSAYSFKASLQMVIGLSTPYRIVLACSSPWQRMDKDLRYRWLITRLQWLQYVSSGVTAVLH